MAAAATLAKASPETPRYAPVSSAKVETPPAAPPVPFDQWLLSERNIKLALALVLGANLGGAIAPFSALTGSPVAARRVPLGNLIARGGLGILMVPFLGWAVTLLSYLSDDPGRLVLNFHTAFNFAVALVFLPLLEPLARAAVAAGVEGVFVEVHEEPAQALSDGANALRLDLLPALLAKLRSLDAMVKSWS